MFKYLELLLPGIIDADYFCYMFKNWKLKIGVELISWLFTALIVVLFLIPITRRIYQYPFLWMNVLFIVVFITITRYIFLLKYTFLGYSQRMKALLILACAPGFIFILRRFKSFQEYLGERGVEQFMIHLPHDQQVPLAKYVTAEMIFFGAGSLMVIILFAIRMLISIWRQHNKGTV